MKKKILMMISCMFIIMSVISCNKNSHEIIATYEFSATPNKEYILIYFKDNKSLLTYLSEYHLIDTHSSDLDNYWNSEVLEYKDNCFEDIIDFYDKFSDDVLNVIIGLEKNFIIKNGYYLVLSRYNSDSFKLKWKIDILYYIELIKNRKIFSTTKESTNEEAKYLDPYASWYNDILY